MPNIAKMDDGVETAGTHRVGVGEGEGSLNWNGVSVQSEVLYPPLMICVA